MNTTGNYLDQHQLELLVKSVTYDESLSEPEKSELFYVSGYITFKE